MEARLVLCPAEQRLTGLALQPIHRERSVDKESGLNIYIYAASACERSHFIV